MMFSVGLMTGGKCTAADTSLAWDCELSSSPSVLKYCHVEAGSVDGAIELVRDVLQASLLIGEAGKWVDLRNRELAGFSETLYRMEENVRRRAAWKAFDISQSRTMAAKILGVNRKTLYRWL